MLKILFMGTPQFSVPILEALISKYDVVGVITQPDKEVGRNHQIAFSPVKECALKHNIPVYQPVKIRKDYQELLKIDCDMIVTAAYGQIVGTELLNYPKHKAINVHGSLLPKYRGGAPIQRSIMNGDEETGITIMYMAKGMDSGAMLTQQKVAIDPEDDSGSLFQKLSYVGRDLLLATIPSIVDQTIIPQIQNEEEVTFAYNIQPTEELMNWQLEANALHNLVRALSPSPLAYFEHNGERYKVGKTRVSSITHDVHPGVIVQVCKKYFTIACGNQTCLDILTIQPPSKRMMNASDFINGGLKKILEEEI